MLDKKNSGKTRRIITESNPVVCLARVFGAKFIYMGVVFFLLAGLGANIVFGAVQSQISVSWNYPDNIVGLAGFKLYQDGGVEPVCQVEGAEARSMLCDVTFGDTPSVFTMTAYNVTGAESAKSLDFEVSPPAAANQAPVAIAVVNVAGSLAADFDGGASSDPDGGIVSYLWEFGDGDSAVGVQVGHVFPAAGTYTGSLTVTDTSGATARIEFNVTVESAGGSAPNSEPIPVIIASAKAGEAPLAVTFDGTGSRDDGAIVAYSWAFGDGDSATWAQGDHIFVAPGVYTVSLSVVDDAGLTAQTTVSINVGDSGSLPSDNLPPQVVVVASTQEGTAPLAVSFDGAGSRDLDGFITNYSWDFGDGGIGSGAAVTHVFYVPGNYTVKLSVADDRQAISEKTIAIVVREADKNLANESPKANFTASSLAGVAPVFIEFNASLSSDSDGAVVGYSWDFGDGSTGYGMVAQHIFRKAGQHTVSLIVRDDQGATALAQAVVTIEAGGMANKPPRPDFLVKRLQGRINTAAATAGSATDLLAVHFDGSASVDPDGNIVEYLWSLGDGNTAEGLSVDHVYAELGTYTVSLSVMDDQGATAFIEKKVPISDAPVASDVYVSAPAGVEVRGVLEASDPKGLEVVFSVVAQGDKGYVILDPYSGEYIYSPYSGSVGVDKFTYQVSNGSLVSDVSAVTISIEPSSVPGEAGEVPEPETPSAVEPSPSPFSEEAGGGCSIAFGTTDASWGGAWVLILGFLASLGVRVALGDSGFAEKNSGL